RGGGGSMTKKASPAGAGEEVQTKNIATTSYHPAEENQYAPAPAATLPLDRILVGERHRKDMGDIPGLAATMQALGLLQPIVGGSDGTLIAGERRLRAAQMLGWKKIPINVVDLNAVVRGEFAENACRKDFTLTEAVAIKRALEPLERAAAKERQ